MLVLIHILLETTLVHMVLISSVMIIVSSLSWIEVSFLVMVEGSIHSFILMHNFNKLLQNLCKIWVTGQVIQMETTSLLLLISFKVGFVYGLFFLDLSEFFNLIVIYDKGFIIKGLIVQILFGGCCGIWCLVADKSKRVSCFTFRFESNFFNLSEW